MLKDSLLFIINQWSQTFINWNHVSRQWGTPRNNSFPHGYNDKYLGTWGPGIHTPNTCYIKSYIYIYMTVCAYCDIYIYILYISCYIHGIPHQVVVIIINKHVKSQFVLVKSPWRFPFFGFMGYPPHLKSHPLWHKNHTLWLFDIAMENVPYICKEID